MSSGFCGRCPGSRTRGDPLMPSLVPPSVLTTKTAARRQISRRSALYEVRSPASKTAGMDTSRGASRRGPALSPARATGDARSRQRGRASPAQPPGDVSPGYRSTSLAAAPSSMNACTSAGRRKPCLAEVPGGLRHRLHVSLVVLVALLERPARSGGGAGPPARGGRPGRAGRSRTERIPCGRGTTAGPAYRGDGGGWH